MKAFPYNRFVIIGTARTGSSLLWSYLNSHPDILCMRGVFGSTNKINFGKYYGGLDAEYYSKELIQKRNNFSIAFLGDYVFKIYNEPYKAVGFKYFYDHDRHLSNKTKLINHFKTQKDLKFIHIKRDNLLATLFSFKRAFASKNWAFELNDENKSEKDFKTIIEVKECEEYFNLITLNQQLFDDLLGTRIFQLTYENLLKEKENTLFELQQFLGVKPIELFSSIKQNVNIPLSQSILNYSELKSHFADSKHHVYFKD